MANVYLLRRLELLRRSQNPDGGWAFYSGKQNSWLEPTVFSALALHGEPEADRAWDLVQRWRKPEGSWRLAGNVSESNWTSSLGALLASVRGQSTEATQMWLAKAVRSGGWPWKDETTPAVEPTAWGTLAAANLNNAGLVEKARAVLLAETLTPESCGLVLLALRGSAAVKDLTTLAVDWHAETASALTRARLALGLRANGIDVPESDIPASKNIAITALEALGARDGRFSTLFTNWSAGGKA